jgi:hypothetical protein
MSIQKIIQESIAGNPLEMKEALAEELRNRVAEALAAKMEEAEQIDEADAVVTHKWYSVKHWKDGSDHFDNLDDHLHGHDYKHAALGNTSRNRPDHHIGIPVKAKSAIAYMEKHAKPVNESFDLDEAVEVSHDRYMRSHGKKASGGSGNWMFTHKAMGDVDYNDKKQVHTAPSGKFSDAKKSAQEWAKKHGHSTVYVMEEVEQIDEVSKNTLRSYVNKKAHSIIAKDDASDRYGVGSKGSSKERIKDFDKLNLARKKLAKE